MSHSMPAFDYYSALLDGLKKPSSCTGLRNAALEHLLLGISQADAARKHGVSRSNLNRLLKNLAELDGWLIHVHGLRSQMVSSQTSDP